jgi:sugar phosphate permease
VLVLISGLPVAQAIIVFMIGFFLYGPQMLIGMRLLHMVTVSEIEICALLYLGRIVWC